MHESTVFVAGIGAGVIVAHLEIFIRNRVQRQIRRNLRAGELSKPDRRIGINPKRESRIIRDLERDEV